jgi:hypothetical protein
MANNFGLKSRSMKTAGKFALKKAAQLGHVSFSTSGTETDRWNLFIDWLKENYSEIKKMEEICFEVVCEYGKDLAFDVSEDELAVSTAHNYLSAINTVMNLATQGQWVSVSPTLDCKIPNRSYIRTEIPASYDRAIYRKGHDFVLAQLGERAASIVELCRELGLRSKEASLVDAKRLLNEAKTSGVITIFRGTKGGRERALPANSSALISVLERASKVQGDAKSLIPVNQSWKQWREGGLRETREAIQKSTGASGLHDLRAGYASELYKTLTGFSPPVMGGARATRSLDLEARQVVAEILGHGRPEISNSYVGGRR